MDVVVIGATRRSSSESASARSPGGNPGEDTHEQRMARFVDGYDRAIEALAAPVLPRVRLGHAVKHVDWARGAVRVTALARNTNVIVKARLTIVTVPVSLLQPGVRGRGAIAVEPEVPVVRTAASQVAMGQVARATW